MAMQTLPDDLDADVGIVDVTETVLVVPVVGIGVVETVFFVGTVVDTRSYKNTKDNNFCIFCLQITS
jgi:hypothetical protein